MHVIQHKLYQRAPKVQCFEFAVTTYLNLQAYSKLCITTFFYYWRKIIHRATQIQIKDLNFGRETYFCSFGYATKNSNFVGRGSIIPLFVAC